MPNDKILNENIGNKNVSIDNYIGAYLPFMEKLQKTIQCHRSYVLFVLLKDWAGIRLMLFEK